MESFLFYFTLYIYIYIYIYDLVVNALSRILLVAESNGLFVGVQVGNLGLRATDLQFADDTLIFCNSDLNFLLNIKSVLRCFEMASGLGVNFARSCLVGFGVSDEVLNVWVKKICCKVGSMPIEYLALPPGVKMRRVISWNALIDRIEHKLPGWKCIF